MFGKLSLDAVPFHEPIVMVTIAGIILGGLALVGLITYFGKWTYLWKEWLTSVDHKRLGIMYIIVAIVMLLRGFADAIMMRSQQALASAGEAGFLPPHHYDQIFYRARRDYDLLRGDAFRYRSDEPGGSAADRRA
ncbi:hypothetical protein O5707_06780 [Escherichia coli]|nr:hypothetical protein [Escherichia coli]